MTHPTPSETYLIIDKEGPKPMGNKTQFTPGPWKIFRTSGGAVLGIGDAEAGGITDYQGGFWRSGKEKIANIHLVAAAPDLYEALKAILHTYDDGGVALGEAFQMANIALAKARGES